MCINTIVFKREQKNININTRWAEWDPFPPNLSIVLILAESFRQSHQVQLLHVSVCQLFILLKPELCIFSLMESSFITGSDDDDDFGGHTVNRRLSPQVRFSD